MTPATPPDPVHFVYEASASCPTKDEFAKLVSDRGNVIWESEVAARTLDVTMSADPNHTGKWHGSLRVADGTSAPSERSIEGATCADVAHSLAIFTSIALTPVTKQQASAPTTTAATTTTSTPSSEPMGSAQSPYEQPKDTYTEPDVENAPTLHRHRFALSGETMIVNPLLQPSIAFGVGLTGRYYFSERFGLKVDADFIRSDNHSPQAEYGLASDGGATKYYKAADEIGGKGMIGAEFVLNRAVGTLAQGHIDLRNIPADLMLDAGFGAVWTRPLSLNDPAFRTFSYQADLAFQLGWGARVFITRSLAFNFGTSVTMYNAHEENTAVAASDTSRADSTTWYGASAIQFDWTTRAAFEVFF